MLRQHRHCRARPTKTLPNGKASTILAVHGEEDDCITRIDISALKQSFKLNQPQLIHPITYENRIS